MQQAVQDAYETLENAPMPSLQRPSGIWQQGVEESGVGPVSSDPSMLPISVLFDPSPGDSVLVEIDDMEGHKQRYEMRDGRIRALYGHSLPGRLAKTPAEPPDILYHGTSALALDAIRAEGLKPMGRQYMHLSTDEATAVQVARRKRGTPVILRVRAGEAHRQGHAFYIGNERVWLADGVPPEFLLFPA